MKSVKKALREGIFTALAPLSVPVYEGFENVPQNIDEYVAFGGITNTSDNSFSTFTTTAVVDLNICQKTRNSFSHETVDDLEDEILEILIPSVDTPGFTVSGFQAINAIRLGSDYVDEPGTHNNISRIVLRIQVTLTQQ